MDKSKLKERVSDIAIELLKNYVLIIITALIAFPLMVKGFFWFIGLWGYNLT